MADILTLTFRTFMSDAGLDTDSPGSPVPTAGSSALLVGPQSISRSVLLLAAVTAASELDVRVVFFTQTQIQSLPLSLQKRVPNLSPEGLKKITFSYPRTAEQLLQQVSRLHEPPSTCPTPPSLLVVDGLESFLCARGHPPEERGCAAHLAALLCDTAAFLTRVLGQRGSGSAPCRVLASFHTELDPDSDPVLNVLDRYFQVRCALDPGGGYEAEAAGLQELWHVGLSGRGGTEAMRAGARWQLLLFPNGLMEFQLLRSS